MNHETIIEKIVGVIFLLFGIISIIQLFIFPFDIIRLSAGIILILVGFIFATNIKLITKYHIIMLFVVLLVAISVYDEIKILSIIGMILSLIMLIWAIVIEIQEHRKD